MAHQEVEISDIVRQAESLKIPLLGVPLHSGPTSSYKERVEKGLHHIAAHSALKRLCFGDLHLEHIRQWRFDNLLGMARDLGAELHFPVWKVPYDDLAEDLERSGVPCVISAVTIGDTMQGEPGNCVLAVGELYCRDLTDRLPDGVDKFGENGEFHTLAQVWLAADAGLSGLL